MGPSSRSQGAESPYQRMVFVDGRCCRNPLRHAIRRHAMLSVTRANANHYLFVPFEPQSYDRQRPHYNHLGRRCQKVNAHTGKRRSTEDCTGNAQKSQWCVNEGEHNATENISLYQTMELLRSPSLSSSGPVFPKGSLDVAETAQWLFSSRLRSSQAYLYATAEKHWVDQLWDVAKQHDLVLKCVSLSMLLKKAALLGTMNWASYFAEKATLIQNLQLCLRRSTEGEFEPGLALAIAMLAELESRDVKDASTARLHVKALARLVPPTRLQGIAWRFAIRVDLRQALWAGQKPVLPYWIPLAYEKQLSASLDPWQYDLCLQLANENSQTVPKSAALPHPWSYELFRDMHLLSFAWDAMVAESDPPFGTVYSLAYRIRVLHAESQASGDESANVVLVELTLIALQLQAWILSRYWVSQTQNVQSWTLQRAFGLLNQDLRQTWSTYSSSASCLWVLVTVASARFDFGAYDNSLLNDLLAQTCQDLNIKSYALFKAELIRWPWLDNWTASRVELVWAELSEVIPDAEHTHQLSEEAIQLSESFRNSGGNSERYFVGGLEFYNSL